MAILDKPVSFVKVFRAGEVWVESTQEKAIQLGFAVVHESGYDLSVITGEGL